MTPTATVLATRLLVRARLRHLQVLAKAAELGSVQRAADAVGLTQPSTSHVLADLERLIECKLFDRHARGVTPTAVTVELLPLVQQIIGTVGACAEVISTMSQHAQGVVRITAVTGAIHGLLAPLLPAFGRSCPDVLVRLDEIDVTQVGARLAGGGVDLLFCRTPAVLPEGWVFEPLRADRFVAVCGPQNHLARRGPLPFDDLWREPWLQMPVDSSPRRVLDELATEAGVSPRYRMVNARSPTVLVTMLQQEDLLALVPLSIARQAIESGQLVVLPVDIPRPFAPIGVLRPIQLRGEAAATFLGFVERFAAEEAPARAGAASGPR